MSSGPSDHFGHAERTPCPGLLPPTQSTPSCEGSTGGGVGKRDPVPQQLPKALLSRLSLLSGPTTLAFPPSHFCQEGGG